MYSMDSLGSGLLYHCIDYFLMSLTDQNATENIDGKHFPDFLEDLRDGWFEVLCVAMIINLIQ